MKKWPWNKILVGVGWLMVVAGTSADTKVEIGPPDATSSLSYAIPLVAGWAAFAAIPGAILLLVLLVVGALRQRKSAVTA